ncbi:MAG: LysR family transcriptional regulator, partial [Microcystaceae cyanobacterium]
GLGAAFVSTTAIKKELEMKVLHIAPIREVVVRRILSVVMNPNRYRSKAAEAFIKEILPPFSSYPEALEPETKRDRATQNTNIDILS